MAHATHKTPRKLLVIGNGMVGHRYLEELVKRHPCLLYTSPSPRD